MIDSTKAEKAGLIIVGVQVFLSAVDGMDRYGSGRGSVRVVAIECHKHHFLAISGLPAFQLGVLFFCPGTTGAKFFL